MGSRNGTRIWTVQKFCHTLSIETKCTSRWSSNVWFMSRNWDEILSESCAASSETGFTAWHGGRRAHITYLSIFLQGNANMEKIWCLKIWLKINYKWFQHQLILLFNFRIFFGFSKIIVTSTILHASYTTVICLFRCSASSSLDRSYFLATIQNQVSLGNNKWNLPLSVFANAKSDEVNKQPISF